MVMNQVVVGSSAVEFTTSSEPSSPGYVGLLEVGPRLGVAVDTLGVCEVVRSSSVRSSVMSPEHCHVSTVSLSGIVVPIVLEGYSIQEGFEIEGLSCADDIVASWFFLEWENFSCDCGTEHSDCVAAVAVSDC